MIEDSVDNDVVDAVLSEPMVEKLDRSGFHATIA